jgi:hypothetical protein
MVKNVDTDDLTPMAYETLTLAHQACAPMRAEIGAAASGYCIEDDYLVGVAEFLEVVLEAPRDYLERWDLTDEIEVKTFARAVRRTRAHVMSTLSTPRRERGKPPFEE